MGGALAFGFATHLFAVVEERHSVPSPMIPLAIVGLLLGLVEWRSDRVAPAVLAPRSVIVGLVALGGYALAKAVSSVDALDTAAVSAEAQAWVKNVVIVAGLVAVVTTPRRVRWVLWTVVAAAALIAVPALVQVLAGTHRFLGGLTYFEPGTIAGSRVWLPAGPVGDANEFARQALVLLAFVGFAALMATGRWSRRAAIATGLCLVALVFATRSRGGLVAMLAMGLVAIAMSARSRRQLRTWIVGFVAVVALAFGVATAFGVTKDFGDIGAYFGADVPSDSSAALHASTFRAGLRMWADHPVFGVGPGNFELHYLPIAADLGIESTGRPRAPHNVAVELLAETGLVGLVVFAGMAVAVGWPMRLPLRRPVLLAAVGFAVAGFTQGLGVHAPLLLIASIGLIAHRPGIAVR